MPYHLVDKQAVYDGKKLRLELHHVEDDDGRHSKREVVVHPGAVTVLPFLDDETILLIRNHRYSVGQVLLELPAGTLEKGEDPINCAGRELVEETGYLAGRLQPVASFFTSPGILTEKMYVFAAYDLEKGPQALEEGEEIEVAPTRWDDAIRMLQTGQIMDGKTIATLLLYDRFRRAR